MTQREAVFQAVVAVVGDVHGAVTLTDSQKKDVFAILFEGFSSGAIPYGDGIPTPEKLKKYIPGLVNNWLRKDPNLNGGTKYVTKNPGSRVGSGDPTLQAMKQLLASTSDPEAKVEIQKAIDERIAELRPKVVIDVNNLPEHLRKFVQG